MYIATAKEMQNIDKRAMDEYSIPALLLMENASIGIVRVVEDIAGSLHGKRITVIAGKGNNGGDGLAAARHCYNRGAYVSVFLLSELDALKGDAAANLQILLKMNIKLYSAGGYDIDTLRNTLSHSDIIIDAIIGTGLTLEIKGGYRNTIEAINNSKKPVVSVDIPTGINSDTGEIMGIAVRATATVTFAIPKRGHFLFPGSEYTGKLHVVDISIPVEAVEKESIYLQLITEEWIRKNISPRPPDSHKGTFGHVLVVAGSIGKGGAAIMTALSALRSGAGLVTLALPASVQSIMAGKSAEIMTYPLPETYDKTISFTSIDTLLKLSKDKDVVAIGPGLTTNKDTVTVVRRIIKDTETPVVIDADGLNALVGHLDILKERKYPTVLTPHPGEMGRLIGKTSADIQKDRIGFARTFAMNYNVYLVLKGAHTVIAEPSGKVYISIKGNPGMATAGTGDVLTGILAGMTAQRYDISRAIRVGVFIHGLAGDMAAKDLGTMGMIAGDLIDRIPLALKKVVG